MAVAFESSRVDPQDRFSRRTEDCPICGGCADDPRHKGVRCYGHYTSDHRYAICTNDDYAGDLRPNRNGHYKHKLDGPCWCNQSHGSPAVTPIKRNTPEKPRKPHKAIPEVWGDNGYHKKVVYDRWRTEDGTRLMVTVRYEGLDADGQRDKATPPFRPVPDGWMNDAEGVARVLYDLPAILAADPWQPVYICEGEKDTERLIDGGLIATTNPFGAGNWHIVPDAPERLRGRRVVIVEHNDKAGRDRTERIAESLRDSAESLRVMRFTEMPEHADVSDWLDAGHTVNELHRMAASLPSWTPSTNERMRQIQEDNDRMRMMNGRKAHIREHQGATENVKHYLDILASNAKFEAFWRGEPVEVNQKYEAKIRAISDQVLTDGGNIMQESGYIEKRHKYESVGGEVQRRVIIQATPKFLATPIPALEFTKKPTQGRNPKPRKVTCPDCGSENMTEQTYYLCQRCGTRHLITEKPVNAPDEPQTQKNPCAVSLTVEDTATTHTEGNSYAVSLTAQEEFRHDATQPPILTLRREVQTLASSQDWPAIRITGAARIADWPRFIDGASMRDLQTARDVLAARQQEVTA